MAEVDGQEKSEQASDKKLSESRERGQVAKSAEINSFAIFSTGLVLIYLTQQFISSRISSATYSIFNSLDILNININVLQDYTRNGLIYFLITLLPIFGGLFIIAIVVNILQVGFKFSVKALAPKMGKFNPVSGIKKIFFSTSSLVEVAKSLVKLALVGTFTYNVLKGFVLNTENLVNLSITEIVSFMVEAAYSLLWKISLLYVCIAAIDFIFQRFKFRKDMMMTKQEVKEENKSLEGDPQIKSRIKKQQMTMARNRMMKDVPTADVVITNPTHFAIAIKYDPQKFQAPRVVAKGMDEVAQRIKKIATENNVPLHEDRILARTLYKLCEVGDFIPESLFKAVAKILAYIYKLKTTKKKTIV